METHRYTFEIEDAALKEMNRFGKKGELGRRAYGVFDRIRELSNPPELYVPIIDPPRNSFRFSFSRELSGSELEKIAGEGVKAVLS